MKRFFGGPPKFDLSGAVLYAPLWRPDMAGTTFISAPPSHFTCTVTGATWTSSGWNFATDDKIDCGNDASLSFGTGSFAFGGWFKSTGDETGRIIDKGDAVGSPDAYGWGLSPRSSSDSAASGAWRNKVVGIVGYGGTEVVTPSVANVNNDNTFHFAFVVVCRTTNLQYLYLDTAAAVTADISAYSAASTDTTRNLAIGVAYIHTTGVATEYLTGTVGDQFVFNRALSATEISHLYQSTKWRFV